MKPLLALAASLAATPALAHDGLHMHPHGIDAGALLLAASVAAGAAVAYIKMRR